MPSVNPAAVARIRDLPSLLAFLSDELNWPLDPAAAPEDATFDYRADELRVQPAQAARLRGGVVRQLRDLRGGQPWGVFLVEFNEPQVYKTALRQVLRGLVPSRRGAATQRTWAHENLLFICTTRDYDRFTFAHFRGQEASRAVLTTFGWQRGDGHVRTLCEYNLPGLRFPDDRGADPRAWLAGWQSAFDVETVTRRFFTDYRAVFEAAERRITGLAADTRRLFIQKLFNRLMFLVFLERKGWLSFGGRRDYLRALWEAHLAERTQSPEANFYRDRLTLLFFAGLNTAHEVDIVGIRRDGFLQTRIGDVPYLNGGLFEEDPDDRDPAIGVPDEAIGPALDELFYRFNFTVTESTPLDIEVAVDPEMLGKIFEELVTGRHETGSYYTPKPVVAFMCREALKAYLASRLPGEAAEALACFVDEHDPAGLRDPEAVLEALKNVRACDPACGSGAYLVGMLHELLDLRACLFAARRLDAKTVYERKLEIIQHNLYGVDIDPFAVNIARLRLWLSLIVDYAGDDPPPLPNLDFKIEAGDSLTGPDPSGGLQLDLYRTHQIETYFALKADYLMAHGGEKLALRDRIAAQRQEIAEWARQPQGGGGFDWAVEFAEVFTDGGFDIVLANPPYVRQELLGKEYKEKALKPIYPEVYSGAGDLYVYFYARAHQLLRREGAGCFISSNKWLRAGYGEKLRQHLLDAQAFRLVVDFGDQPVFQAATAYPCVFLWQKQPRGDTPTTWAVVQDLSACYAEGIREHVARVAHAIPAAQFGRDKPRLAVATTADRRTRMEASGPRLGELVKGQIYRGIITGLNEAFIIDGATRDRLIAQDPKSAEIIKPLLVGNDVRRYETHYRENHLIWTYIGVPIERYPAVLAHLEQFREKAEVRWDQGQYWWELRACDYYDAFAHSKIMYPVIAPDNRFSIETRGCFGNDKTFMLPMGDWFLLGVLNSDSVFRWVTETLSPLRGGYYEFRASYLGTLSIPDAPVADREAVAKLAQVAQSFHTQRRQRVEQFFRELGTSPAQSTSRNPLEQPWVLAPEEFVQRVRKLTRIAQDDPMRVYVATRDETAALTEQIAAVEREIDERVAGLYGL